MYPGAKRISSTLHGLVNYARPGPLVLSKISLHRLIEDTLAFLEHQPMLRGKQLENTVPRDLPHIRADANQLSGADESFAECSRGYARGRAHFHYGQQADLCRRD